MMIPEQKPKAAFTPNIQLCFYLIFGVGVASSVALLVGAIVAVSYLINLAMTVVVECVTHIATLYSTSDHLVQLLILCIVGYCLLKLVVRSYKSFSKEEEVQ